MQSTARPITARQAAAAKLHKRPEDVTKSEKQAMKRNLERMADKGIAAMHPGARGGSGGGVEASFSLTDS